ncbi:serine/threonine-protein kinase DCLK1 [Drosophila innubila]|uniref:serine/threonine-protein kinase DCLK1 n=1 Tax=Drosophila innubila TaxID=198719 RepID=UPI00148BC35A|nr:serine/threonine-protein kinase DCLK1 [Drosophila innubila]
MSIFSSMYECERKLGHATELQDPQSVSLCPLTERRPNKARRACFLRNMDPNFGGILLTISKKHYQVIGKLLESLTVSLSRHVLLKSAINRIYRVDGTQIFDLDDIFDGDIIVCCCKKEAFLDVGYKMNKSYVQLLGSIMRMNEKFNGNENNFLSNITTDQLPESITLYIAISRLMSQTKWSAIFEGYGRAKGNLAYIVKMVDKQHMNVRTNNTYSEIAILRKLQSHENIIDLFYTVEQSKYDYIVAERLNCDLLNLLISNPAFDEKFVQRIMIDVAKGLEYIHSSQIIHRDIKLENLLVQLKTQTDLQSLDISVVKIGDFGLATYYEGRDLYQWCGTPHYMAPELVSYAGYDFRVDCWSLGVSLYFLLCNQLPYGNDCSKQEEVLDSIQKDFHSIPSEYVSSLSIEAQHLINSLLDKSRLCRISATEIRKHPFLQIRHE